MDELALLEGLLNLYSPTQHEAEAVNYLVAQMQAAGLTAFVDEAGNAVGMCGAGEEAVILLGHIDTVPGFIPVTRAGDVLRGRGAVDAKGPLACFTAAAVRAQAAFTDKRLIVIGAVGEEGDSRGAHFIKDKYRPAFTIIGEPSGWGKITLGYKGSAWFEYTARRALAHTSAQNESACEAAVSFWNRVMAWAQTRNADKPKMFEQALPTLRAMQSDSDGFVESARLKFGVRLPPGLSPDALNMALSALAPDVILSEAQNLHSQSGDPSLTLRVTNGSELKLLEGVPAYRGEKNTPLVRAFLAAIRAAGGQPGFTVKSGTSDMNIVAPLWGTPIVAYGPGDSSLDHTPEEHILISEYQRAIEVLTNTLLAL